MFCAASDKDTLLMPESRQNSKIVERVRSNRCFSFSVRTKGVQPTCKDGEWKNRLTIRQPSRIDWRRSLISRAGVSRSGDNQTLRRNSNLASNPAVCK